MQPEDDRSELPEERRRRIAEILREQGSISIAALEAEFGVSPMTARRDLALLAESGLATRTHGGAVLPDPAGFEDSFRSRVEQDVEAKSRLARAVVATLESDQSLFLDSSSTAYHVARAILDARLRITLLTNSLPVMTLISFEHPTVNLIGLGGDFRKLTQSFLGPETVSAIARYAADGVVFSVKGITRDGDLTDPNPLEAEVKRAMIERAQTAVLAATGRKFDERGLSVIANVERVSTAFIADPRATNLRSLEARGVDVRTV
jgi:DeoR/GlpR family transcriptional regulator of sugar metabolism